VDSVVRNNTAAQGGGIFIGGDQLCGGSCPSNTAATKATLTLTDSVVDGNTGNDRAGGIFTTRTTLTLTNSLVSRNTANGTGLGGGMMLTDATVATLTGARVARNTTVGQGGGIWLDFDVALNISSSAFHNNTAAQGGGLFVSNTGNNSGAVSDTLFVDNGGIEIIEQCPASSSATRFTYTNNILVNSGSATIYTQGGCGGSQTIAGFEGLGNTSGNTGTLTLGTVQSHALFMAVPDVALDSGVSPTASVLAWSVVRANTGVIIDPGANMLDGQSGAFDVTAAQTYTLNATVTGSSAITPLQATVLGAPTRLLLVTAGPGGGTLTASPPGTACGAVAGLLCYASQTAVTVTATPSGGSVFSGFSGCDSVAGNQCTVAVSSFKVVIGTFSGGGSSLILQLNQSAPYHPGQTMTLIATLSPGPTPTPVDVYVVVQLPNLSFLSLQLNGGVVSGIVPIAQGIVPFQITTTLLQYTFNGGEPVGNYAWLGGLTAPGTLNVVGNIATAHFSFGP
jgi:hypothetical protein